MLKLLYVDPWGINGLDEYSNNLLTNLNENNIEICYLSNHYSNFNNNSITDRHYFRYSEKNKSIFRLIIRFLEYLINQLCLIYKAYQFKPNIIHIQWSLFFLYDLLIIIILKKILPKTKLVFTLHNIKNHTYNDQYL